MGGRRMRPEIRERLLAAMAHSQQLRDWQPVDMLEGDPDECLLARTRWLEMQPFKNAPAAGGEGELPPAPGGQAGSAASRSGQAPERHLDALSAIPARTALPRLCGPADGSGGAAGLRPCALAARESDARIWRNFRQKRKSNEPRRASDVKIRRAPSFSLSPPCKQRKFAL